jgi:glutamate racemase
MQRLERVAGAEVTVIDSGEAIARRTRFLLTKLDLLAGLSTEPIASPRAPGFQDKFWCSGDAEHFSLVASMILQSPVRSRAVQGMLIKPGEVA